MKADETSQAEFRIGGPDEPRSAEHDLRDSTLLLRAISDSWGDVIFAKDRQGRMVYANPATLALIGKPADQVLGRTDEEFLEDKAAAREVMANDRRVMESGVALETEERVPRADGTHRVWLSRKSPYRDDAGRVVGLLGISRDITQRKRAHEALRVSEERYRTLFTNMAEGFALGEAICDDAGVPCDFRLLEMNEAFEAQSGLRRSDAEGRPMRTVLPNLEQHWVDVYGGVALSGTPVRFESYNRDLDRHFSVFCYSPSPGRFATVFTDVTARKRADEALQRVVEALNVERDKFAAIIAHLPVGVGITNPAGNPLSMNEAGLRLHGFRSQEEMYLELSRYAERFELRRLDGELLPFEEWPVARALRGDFVSDFEVHLRNRDAGTERIATYSTAPIRDAAGETLLLVHVMQDVTEAKRAEAALRSANDLLRENDRRKDEFLGMLSHELRNPLAPLRNASYVLRIADPASEQARRAQEVIERQTDHLTRLVDDLLDVTRIARGKIELRRSRVDLREIAHRASDDFRLLLQDRGIALRTELPDVAVWVDVDATRITQVVGNLLHNAAKFTRSGDEVTVTLRGEGPEAEIRVTDSGAGIDPALLPHVFDAFVQGERTLARSEGGLGLGLAFVKGIVELHGGAARAESAGQGKGSAFTITLPREGTTPAQDASPPEPAPATAGRRVLVVDDNADAAESLADVVDMLGHTVRVAYDGPSAITMAREAAPDVVLCDIGLPTMDGYAVAGALRAIFGDRIKLFAVTGYAQPEDVKRAIAAGFDAHIAKPPRVADIERLLA